MDHTRMPNERATTERSCPARSGTRLACAALALLWSLSGCLDLDGLRNRAGDAEVGVGCEGRAEDLRLWKLHLGQSDYLTIKNVGSCRVELGGLHVFFDDHSELFPDFEIDCLVRLPPFTLHSGAEVRVHEDGVAGDIAALDNVLSGCGEGVPFNPMRGGVAYLCDGACDQDRVLDVVGFVGDSMGAPELRFRQHFDGLLAGVTQAMQNSARYARVAGAGRAPDFVGSDWALEERYLHADFESGVEVELSGEILPFSAEPGQRATVSTTSNAAIGGSSLRLVHRGSDGRSEGLGIDLVGIERAPSHLGFFVRMDRLPGAGGYLDLRSGDLTVVVAGFEGRALGTERENGQRSDVTVSEGAFHQVELRNLDWASHDYDLYVDRVLLEKRLPFWSNVNEAERLSLYSVSAGSTADYDELEAWRFAP
jgi:hypothetical protein